MIRLAAGADVLIVTGGLGPTADDLHEESLAAAMDDALIEDPESLKQIITWFAGRSRPMPELNRVQALRPSRADSLSNGSGTAPGMRGLIATKGKETDVFCLPGPPRRCGPCGRRTCAAALRPARVVRTRAVLTFGMGESEVAAKLGPMMARTHSPLVGTTAVRGVVAVRIRFEGEVGRLDAAAVEEADSAVADIEATIRQRLGPIVFGPAKKHWPA
jgi:nicotinamide-nucleotide amidase